MEVCFLTAPDVQLPALPPAEERDVPTPVASVEDLQLQVKQEVENQYQQVGVLQWRVCLSSCVLVCPRGVLNCLLCCYYLSSSLSPTRGCVDRFSLKRLGEALARATSAEEKLRASIEEHRETREQLTSEVCLLLSILLFLAPG
jgi:hypothetical protein